MVVRYATLALALVVAGLSSGGCTLDDVPQCGTDASPGCPEGMVCNLYIGGLCLPRDGGIEPMPCTPEVDIGGAGGDHPDDGVPNVGEPCAPGGMEGLVYGESSICEPGVWKCGDDGFLSCSGGAGPALELCNGRDDDCDGLGDTEDRDVMVSMPEDADERVPVGTACCAVPLAEAADGGCDGCRWACADEGVGVGAVCVGPLGPNRPDFCGNGDEDCDGEVDEDGAIAEVCGVDAIDNDIDYDCDGRQDEAPDPVGATPEEIGDPDRADFPWPDEMCDGVNNDCDFDMDGDPLIDEGFLWMGLKPGQSCEQGVGECRDAGMVVCDASDRTRAICDATAVDPPPDRTADPPPGGACEPGGMNCQETLCDGKDGDCDGAVDEAFPDLGSQCSAGVGECVRRGAYVCAADMMGVVCDAEPGDRVAESCNDLDDDCDGIVDETCACNPLANERGFPVLGEQALIRVMDDLTDLAPNLSLMGAAADIPGLDSACAPDPIAGPDEARTPRDEQVIIWRPSPGLRRIEVIGNGFDPRIFVADLCRTPAANGALARPTERACVRDSGLAAVAGAPDQAVDDRERAAAVVVEVPDPPPGEVGIFIESQDGRDGPLSVEITDPTGGGVCPKSLTVRGVERTGAALCRKRLWAPLLFDPPGDELFRVVNRDAVPTAPYATPAPEGRWDDPRFCLDNDGRATSVEVDWADISDADGVQGTMLPEGAERGDWWSVQVPAGDGNRLLIEAEPVGLDSACAGNSMRLVAYLTCAGEAPENFQQELCSPTDGRTLRCSPPADDRGRRACVDGLSDIVGLVPKRKLDLTDIIDGNCRDTGHLVLHVGVLREDDPDPLETCPACPGLTVDPDACFTYRLRVTE